MNWKKILDKAAMISSSDRTVVFSLGKVPYAEAFSLQTDLHRLALDQECQGFLLFLQHPPVITIGSNRNLENLLSSPETLDQNNIALVQSTRGGDITFHGPGQLVVYPILNLNCFSKDVSLYVHNLEQLIINTLHAYCIDSNRIKGHRGVFVKDKKIASIGVKIKRWTTMHGLALNVSIDLKYFKHIIACGLKDYPPITMSQVLNRPVPVASVEEQMVAEFEKAFNTETISG